MNKGAKSIFQITHASCFFIIIMRFITHIAFDLKLPVHTTKYVQGHMIR